MDGNPLTYTLVNDLSGDVTMDTSGAWDYAGNATPGSYAFTFKANDGTVGGGGTGVYVKSSSVNDELVSKTKAIVYGIIF